VTILVSTVGLLGVIFALINESNIDEARSFLAGSLEEDRFVEAYGPALTVQLVQSLAQLAAGITVIVWMHRLVTNHAAIGRVGKWKPAWAIGGWFVPPLVLYVIPYLMFREIWRASDPDSDDWRNSPVAPVVTWWFVLFGVLPLVFVVAQGINGLGGLGTGAEAVASQAVDQRSTIWGASLLSLAAALSMVKLARQLSERHRTLLNQSDGRR
jgi:predicted secreted protein